MVQLLVELKRGCILSPTAASLFCRLCDRVDRLPDGPSGRSSSTCQRPSHASGASPRVDLKIEGKVFALGLIEADLGLLNLTG